MRRIGQVVVILALLACSAYASTVTTFNTGVDYNAVTFIDQHYTLAFNATTPGAGVAGPAYFVDPSKSPVTPNGPWFADTGTSAWIGARHDESITGGTGDAPGYYTYTTTFDLTGFVASTASLTGQWSTDNPGIEIILNGNVFSFATPDTAYSQGFFPYSIGSGFVSGVNAIQWVVSNDNCPPGSCGTNPTGFRNEYSVTADASAVPEPGSLALLATGIFGLFLPTLRRMKS
jgi:hypothetical protein